MPIDRSRDVDPQTAEIRLASAKRSPQTALPTLFTKPLAHTFASGATQHLGCRPSLRLKGGHGGDRSKAGLPAGYWQEKGGRAAAAAACGCSKDERLLEEEAAKAAAANRWKQ